MLSSLPGHYLPTCKLLPCVLYQLQLCSFPTGVLRYWQCWLYRSYTYDVG